MSPRLAILLGALLLGVAVAIAAAPRAETPDARVSRISSELRCPVCQGLSVEDSPSDTARQMRALVAQRVGEGRSDEEVRAEFRSAYGDWILLSPPLLDPKGSIWILPLVAIAGGAALVVARLARGTPPARAPSAEQLALLRERARREEALE